MVPAGLPSVPFSSIKFAQFSDFTISHCFEHVKANFMNSSSSVNKIRMTGRLVSDDERTKIAAGVSAFVSQTIWITNGLECKRILKSDPIPDSWKQGRIISKEHKLKMLKARGLKP
jgi:hypothetical protein